MTLLLWCACFLFCAVMLFRNPIWGVALYMLTFFAFPRLWWWGGPLGDYRWNLFGGLGMLLGTVVCGALFQLPARCDQTGRTVLWLLAALVINASFVNYALAEYPEISTVAYQLLIKFALMQFLVTAAIRSREDFTLVCLILLLGAGYIGFEVTINDRGHMHAGRLEGVGAPGAVNSNELSSLMITLLPIAAAFVVGTSGWVRWISIGIAPLVLNVVIVCNSRGAMLAGIAAGIGLLALSSHDERKKMFTILALGSVGVVVLAGNTPLLERFNSIFVSAENRDESASSRLVYWQAGLTMLTDRPLGSGGSAFKNVYGRFYIADIEGEDIGEKAIHNGYINEACEWGVQGLVLHVAIVALSFVALFRSSRRFASDGDEQMAIIGYGVLAGLIAFLVTCVFGDRFDAEWGYWVCGLAIAHANLPTADNSLESTEQAENSGTAATPD